MRRSVANNLNDIGKDNPESLYATLRRWKRDATAQREWLINHALRTAVKRGEAPALEILGYAGKPAAAIVDVDIRPARASIGGSVHISFSLTNSSRRSQPLLVDFCIHYVKSSGKNSPKVFKLKRLELAPGQTVRLARRVSLKQLTTRRHYPGKHRVELLLNGRATPIGAFTVLD